MRKQLSRFCAQEIISRSEISELLIIAVITSVFAVFAIQFCVVLFCTASPLTFSLVTAVLRILPT